MCKPFSAKSWSSEFTAGKGWWRQLAWGHFPEHAGLGLALKDTSNLHWWPTPGSRKHWDLFIAYCLIHFSETRNAEHLDMFSEIAQVQPHTAHIRKLAQLLLILSRALSFLKGKYWPQLHRAGFPSMVSSLVASCSLTHTLYTGHALLCPSCCLTSPSLHTWCTLRLGWHLHLCPQSWFNPAVSSLRKPLKLEVQWVPLLLHVLT